MIGKRVTLWSRAGDIRDYDWSTRLDAPNVRVQVVEGKCKLIGVEALLVGFAGNGNDCP